MIKEILKKLFFIEKPKHRGVTPEEKELQSYLREERLRKIRERLAFFRKKRMNEMIKDQGLMHEKYKILKQKNLFAKNKFMWR